MNTKIITVATGYSLIDLICGNPVLSAELDFLGAKLEKEVSAESQQQFISHMQEAVKSCNILLIADATKDFQTKHIIAKGFEKPLEQNSRALQSIQKYLERSGQRGSDIAYEYAQLPKGAIALTNANGLEQGFMLVYPSICIAALPGSLQCIETVIENEVFPFLLNKLYSGSYTTLVPLLPERIDLVEEYVNLYGKSKGFLATIIKNRGGVWLRIAAALGNGSQSQQACDSFLEDLTSEMGTVSPIRGIGIHGSKIIDKKSEAINNIIPNDLYDDSLLEGDNPPQVEPIRGKKNKKGKNKSQDTSTTVDKVKKGLIITLTLIILVAGGYLGWYYYASYKNKSNYNTLKDVYNEHTLIAPPGYPKGYDKNFSSLWQINPDAIGWLSLSDTALDYPVVQTTDNQKYYRTNFQGSYSEHAVPFVDSDVDLSKPSKNTIIYGHNIRTDGQMFNILRGYQKLDFYQAHPVIEFNNVYNKGKYVIFSVFYANTLPEHGQIFPYIEFINPVDDAETQAYIDGVSVRSMFNTGVPVSTSDEFLTLSTCSYEYKDARFVVVARKLRSGESEKWDTTQAVNNPSPLYPDVWYKLFGGTKPNVSAGPLNFSSGKAAVSGTSTSNTASTTPPDNSQTASADVSTTPKTENSTTTTTPKPPAESTTTTTKPADKDKTPSGNTTNSAGASDKNTQTKPTTKPETTAKDTAKDDTKVPEKDTPKDTSKDTVKDNNKDESKDQDTTTATDKTPTDNSGSTNKDDTLTAAPDNTKEPEDTSKDEQPESEKTDQNQSNSSQSTETDEKTENTDKVPEPIDPTLDTKKKLPAAKTQILSSAYVSSLFSNEDTTYQNPEDKPEPDTTPEAGQGQDTTSPSTGDLVANTPASNDQTTDITPPASPQPPQTNAGTSTDEENKNDVPSDMDKKEESNNNSSNEVPNNTNAGNLTVKYNGNTMSDSAINIVGAMVEAEMGSTFQVEALKAQAVAAYTYVKYYNNNGGTPSVVMKTPVTSKVQTAVASIIGQAVYYNGTYVEATYSASSAGKTNAAIDYWGSKGSPYLVSVDSPGDELIKAFGAKKTFSESEMAQHIQKYSSVDPYEYGDPSTWFSNPEYVSGKYVKKIQVCGKTVTGREVRDVLLQYKINSNAFEVVYDGGSFVFTTYGYGHGVGLSQQGSDYYAKQGWGYKEILTHYYPGTSVN